MEKNFLTSTNHTKYIFIFRKKSEHMVFFTAEIGINHNGDLEVVKKLIDVAVEAGCDAV